MLGSWMVYTLLVTAVLGMAGLAVEEVLSALRRPTRGAWALAHVASVAIPTLIFGLSGRPETQTVHPAIAGAGFPQPALPLGTELEGNRLADLTWFLSGAWLVSSALLTTGLVVGWRRLNSALADCCAEELSGVRVLVSEDLGPAVTVGLPRRIVVPRWLLDEPAETLDAVVAHERSHMQARDPELILLAALPALLMPWNLPLWWQLARLRLAVEVDCDKRVLAHTNLTKVQYGRLLLDVGSRRRGRGFAGAAFSERPTDLQRRLERMMEKPMRRNGWMVLGMGFVAGAVTAVVFLMPRPQGIMIPLSELLPAWVTGVVPPSPSEVDASPSPVFTPMTSRPEIENVSEVFRAIERKYPPLLRDAGIGGRVVVWFFIDEVGRVQHIRMAQSSGQASLDAAAMTVAEVYEFTPALNGDRPTAVWVQFPVIFQAQIGRSVEVEPPRLQRPKTDGLVPR